MANFKDLQDRINLDYLNQTTLIPETKRAIRTAIRTYEATRFWFNEATSTMTAAPSVSYLIAPLDFLTLDHLEITTTGAPDTLRQQTFEYVRKMQQGAPQGQPTDFAYRGNRFELAAIPNHDYIATIHYIKSLPALSADTDSNEWTNEASNLIAHCATLELLGSNMNTSDDRKVAYHRRQLQMAHNELSLRNETRLNFKLKPTLF